MNSIKEKINQLIIEELEKGTVPRRKTWNTIQVGSNQRPYSGINQINLQIQKIHHNYTSHRRMTFGQIKNLG